MVASGRWRHYRCLHRKLARELANYTVQSLEHADASVAAVADGLLHVGQMLGKFVVIANQRGGRRRIVEVGRLEARRRLC